MTRRVLGGLPFALLALGVAMLALRASAGADDSDLWWHLRLGADFLQQGTLHAPAHWSSLATRAWVPTEPLPEVVLAKAYAWAGFAGITWLYGAACIAVLLALYAGNRAMSGPLPASLVALVAVMGCSTSLTPRPQLVSFALLAVTLRAWNRTADDLEPRWYLIPLMFGWSLCHGFWFIGVAYGVLEVAGLALDRRIDLRRDWQLPLVAVLSGAVVLLNPLGLGIVEAPFAVNDTSQYINEWRHPSLTATSVLLVVLMEVAVAVLWAVERRRPSWRELLLLVSSLVWTWYAWRTVALASVVVAPLLAHALWRLLERSESTSTTVRVPRRAEVGVVVGWTLACLVGLAVAVPSTAVAPATDSSIDRRLDQLPAGTVVLNNYDIGGWLVWRHPDLNQAIDGLITPYENSYVDAYFRARNVKPGWQQFVDRTGARVALLVSDSKLARALRQAGWTIEARDTAYELLQKPSG